jgi:CubicO group peptidase (beta-lactamase class C family)
MHKCFFKAFFCFFILGGYLSAIESATFPNIEKKIASDLGDIDQIVDQVLKDFQVPGLAIGVLVDGKVVLAKGYGYRNLVAKLPVTENTLFAIASVTKAFTTFILGQLVDEEKISWDDPVIKYIPEFRLTDDYATSNLTIRDLVAHRTGLARHDLLWICNSDFKRNDLLRSLQYLEPACKLREKFQYNNLMYTLAGMVIERVTRVSWEESLSSRILQPLEMISTNDSVETSKKSNDFSLPYQEVDGEVKEISFRNLYSVAPAGAINSNVSDMIKWLQLQLSDGTILNMNFISSKTLKEMHTIQMAIAAEPSEIAYPFGYGLGWVTGVYRGFYSLFHDGGIDGFRSGVVLIPQKKIGIVVLTNSNNGGEVTSCLIPIILDKVLGLSDIDWLKQTKENHDNLVKKVVAKDSEKVELLAKTSHNLLDYVGNYEHPSYGLIKVKLKDNLLKAIYGDIEIPLFPKCYDVFQGRIKIEKEEVIDFLFSSDNSGHISELLIPFEPSVKSIPFQKIADSELFSTDKR